MKRQTIGIGFVTIIIFGILIGSALQLGLIQFQEYIKVKYSTIEGQKVYIESSIVNKLNEDYRNRENEFIYCIYGNFDDTGYYITEISETKVYEETPTNIEYENCPENSLGSIHSHPNANGNIAYCSMSLQDAYTFGKTGNPLTGIICGEDHFGFYKFGDVYQRLLVEYM